MSGRRYEGHALNGTDQPLSEAPHWAGEGETVDVTPQPDGKTITEDVPVPVPSDEPDRPDVEGQTTLADYTGWSA